MLRKKNCPNIELRYDFVDMNLPKIITTQSAKAEPPAIPRPPENGGSKLILLNNILDEAARHSGWDGVEGRKEGGSGYPFFDIG